MLKPLGSTELKYLDNDLLSFYFVMRFFLRQNDSGFFTGWQSECMILNVQSKSISSYMLILFQIEQIY